MPRTLGLLSENDICSRRIVLGFSAGVQMRQSSQLQRDFAHDLILYVI